MAIQTLLVDLLVVCWDWQTGLDPDPSGAESLRVSSCIPQLKFDRATSIVTKERIPISEGLQDASGKEKL